MTRRSSLRAQAREIYRELVRAKAKQDVAPTLTLPRKRGREQEETVTEKVRALYEHSVVPVAEIARVAGVTERTIYKYAQKGGWQPRYAWIDRGGVKRGRGWRAGKDFTPAKGAGSRFIRRADKDKPFAVGFKATDPAGAARATTACGAAASLSREAQREAEAEQRSEALNRALELNNTALRNLREFHQARGKGPPGPLDDRIEDVLVRVVTMALTQVQALAAKQSTSVMPGLDPGIHEAPPR